MGLGDFFRRRRERESAIPQGSSPGSGEALGSFARTEGQPVVGEQVGVASYDAAEIQGGIPGMADSLAALAQLGPLFQQAMLQGNVQIQHGDAQTIDMRGTGLREEIIGIMRAHGIDPDTGSAQAVDTSAYGDMQQQMLDALARHGIDPGASGTSINFQIDSGDEQQR